MTASLADLRALVEGAFRLEEWWIDGRPVRPPQAEGQIVFLDGTITMVVRDLTVPGRTVTVVMLGAYELNADTFINEYPTSLMFNETPEGVARGEGPGFPGKRTYYITQDEAGVKLTAGETQFVFSRERMTISDGGQLIRVWRRASA